MSSLFSSPLQKNPAKIATQVKAGQTAPLTHDEAIKTLKTYDYVVLGGGNAGCVLANRLTASGKHTVLLVEAGYASGGLPSKAPLSFSKLFHSKFDYDFYTTKQKHVEGRELYWPRAKMLGGCSSMNAMIAHHCAPSDYDEWAQTYGAVGWDYESMRPYFRRMEVYTPRKTRPALNVEFRSSEGPVQISHSAHSTESSAKGFVKGCEAVGIPYNPDLNTPAGSEGVTDFMTTIDQSGVRSSSATAYLTPDVRARKNLTIAIETSVTRILFDTSASGPVAIGAELQSSKDGPLFRVAARNEVILSAGAIHTPQILTLSGIGPQAELAKHGITPVRANDTVGTQLRDHFCCNGIVCHANDGASLDYLTNDIKAIPALVRWLATGTGPLTSNVAEVAAFVRTNDERLPFETEISESRTDTTKKPAFHGSLGKGPDLEIITAPLHYVDHGAELAPPGVNTYAMVPVGLRPQSSGTVTLASASIWDKPIIDANYWADDNDVRVLVAGIRLCLAIAHSEPMKKYLKPSPLSDEYEPDNTLWPWKADPNKITDKQLRDWMGKKAFTLYHPVGTARMGPDPSTSVVNPELKVHGVKGLRVCDASIFPMIPSGHPQMPVYAVAERASDLILKETAAAAEPVREANL